MRGEAAVPVARAERAALPFANQAGGFGGGRFFRRPVAVHQVVERLQEAVARRHQAAALGAAQAVEGEDEADQGVAAVAAGEGSLFAPQQIFGFGAAEPGGGARRNPAAGGEGE